MQDVEKVIKRSRQYWYVDGITELYMGSISLLAGLFYLGFEGVNALVRFLFVPTQAVPFLFYSPWVGTVLMSYSILFSSLVGLTLFLQQRATKFRESFTYPRIGYLAPRTSKCAPNLILATIFIGIQLLLAYMFISPFIALTSPYISANMILLVGCLCFSCLYLYPAVSSALIRFYVLSAVSTFLSVVLFQTSIISGMNMILYTTLMGVALLVSGGFTFQNFSRQNPLPKEELVTSDDLENTAQDIEEKMTNEEIQEVIKRSPFYWFVDGIVELSIGNQWIFLILIQLGSEGIIRFMPSLQESTPAHPPLLTSPQLLLLQICLYLIFVVSLGCLVLIPRRLVQRQRERFTYPRIAYLESRTPAPKQKLNLKTFKLIVNTCLIVFMIVFTSIVFFVPPNILSLVTYLSFSFMFLYPAVSLGLNRFYILTTVSILLSIVLFQLNIVNGIRLYLPLMGLALMISGWFTFRNFLRQNPLPEEEV